MARAFCGVLILLAAAKLGWTGEIILDNRSPRPLSYQARYSGKDVWTGMLTLAPGAYHSHSTDVRLVVRFSDGRASATAVLWPDRRYRYQLNDEMNRGEVVDAGFERPGRPEVRRLAVLAIADETYRKFYPDWEDRIAEIVATASNYFDEEFAIRLRLVECRAWEYEVGVLGDPEKPMHRLLREDSPYADLVIGWVAMAQGAPGQPGYYTHSAAYPFGRHILIADVERRLLYGAAQALVQQLAITFGAFDVLDRKSIMQKLLENVPYPWQFGDIVRQVILLSRELNFRQGVKSLPPEAIEKIRELYREHHHPDDSPSDDPISRAYRPPHRPPRTAACTAAGRPGV